MNLYNLIQEKIFQTYEEWHMKNPIYDSNGFHIVGIDNSLKAMRDGYIMYTELYPPHEIKGCTSMKAIVGESEDLVDIYLDIHEKKYCMADLSYDRAIQIMRAFVKKSILPDAGTYVEVVDDGREQIKASFVELSELLLRDPKLVKQFLKKVKPESIEEVESAWDKLCEELLLKGVALELHRKCEKEGFLSAIKQLSAGKELVVNEEILDDDGYISKWCAQINASWTDYTLAAMDVGYDGYVLLVLKTEDFLRAKKLARTLLNRIAKAEEM
ncbi:DUF6630 family protein [Falseniella ignava]